MLSKTAYRISVFILAAAGGFAQSTIPTAVARTTGMIGIAEGQTARFNVLNPGVLPPAAGANCTATLAYWGADGTMLKSLIVTVAPGQAQYLDLFSIADLNLPIDARKQVRATFTVPAIVPVTTSGSSSTSQPNIPVAACTLYATLEILDTVSGKTEAVLGGTHEVPVGPVTASGTSN